MDIVSVMRRVLLRQWWLVISCALVAAALGLLPNLSQTPQYQSTSRVAVTDQAARSSQEADAQISSVRAVGTSTSLVARALKRAGLARDAGAVARDHVAVTGLGTSPVAAITVRDAEPAAAQKLSQAIAVEIVVFFSDRQTNGLKALMVELDKRIKQTQEERARLVATLPLVPTSQQRADLADIDAELGDLRAEHAQARRSLADIGQARVVDPAGVPEPVSSSAGPDALLAGVLGALVGFALAAVRELARPTIRGAAELATYFRAPVLGELSGKGSEVAQLALTRQVAARLSAAAGRAGVDRVVVAGDPERELVAELSVAMRQLGTVSSRSGQLVSAVSAGAPAMALSGRGERLPSRAPERGPGQGPVAAPGLTVMDDLEVPELIAARRLAGVVVLTHRRVQRVALRPVEELIAATGWPVLGVITYRTLPSRDATS